MMRLNYIKTIFSRTERERERERERETERTVNRDVCQALLDLFM